MREVFIKDKKSNHVLRLDGKRIKFVNGKATVRDDEAERIKGIGSPEYMVKEPKKPKEPTKKASSKSKSKKK